MKLFDYQQKLFDKTLEAWASGALNVCLQLETGGGKTALIAEVINSEKENSCVTAHKLEIVWQISLTLAKWGIYHNILGSDKLIKTCVTAHINELKRSYFSTNSRVLVACVDTLISRAKRFTFDFSRFKLLVQDEAHHVLRDNKWGKVAKLFHNARGFYPTATPRRGDGKGLSRCTDGIFDVLIKGPPMSFLMSINRLSRYKIFAPPSDLDLSHVPVGSTGEFSPPKLSVAVHEASITGDIVQQYLRIAPGKLGITFAVDIAAAIEICAEYNRNGVPAAVITSKTHLAVRAETMRKFRNRELLELVNVDILGEGVDVPAVEVVSMGAPINVLGKFRQQFGRLMRVHGDKEFGILIDHVGNVARHGLPDAPIEWDLRRYTSKSKPKIMPVRTCLNVECLFVYESYKSMCPRCNYKPQVKPRDRSNIEILEGDLFELSEEMLDKMRGNIERIDGPVYLPKNLDAIAQRAIYNNHHKRREAQLKLREIIALWAGVQKSLGLNDSEIYKKFYFTFDVDVMQAQVLNAKDAETLSNKINIDIEKSSAIL